MSFKAAGPKELRLDYVGDFLEMPLYGISKVRAQVDVDIGDPTSCVMSFYVSCGLTSGRFIEFDSTKRFAVSGTGAISAEVDLTGFARVQLRVFTASAAADVRATCYLYGYSILADTVGASGTGTIP